MFPSAFTKPFLHGILFESNNCLGKVIEKLGFVFVFIFVYLKLISSDPLKAYF